MVTGFSNEKPLFPHGYFLAARIERLLEVVATGQARRRRKNSPLEKTRDGRISLLQGYFESRLNY
jgi:hypothetical protein